ncbi:MAG: molybdopterin synthase catalytic subunit [Planctomycetaceae bacterium]
MRILEDELDPAAVLAAVRDPACGALATFVGTVRGERDGRRVLRLEYEVLETLALAEFGRIAAALRARHGVRGVAIHHRRGTVPVGGVSVAIAVSAPHRAGALAACAEAIELLKRDAAIWKKEVYPDGHAWLEGS